MFIFLRLLLAHLIGDFPLQSNAIYSAKMKSWHGKLVHTGMVTLMMIVFSFPLWNNPFLWLIIITNGVIHYFQDWIKVETFQRIKNPNNFFIFIIDQILHIAFLLLIGLTPLAHLAPHYSGHSILLKAYFDNQTVFLFICFLVVGFAGIFFIATVKDTFFSKKLSTPYLEPLEKIYGILERSIMFCVLLKSIYWLPSLSLFLLPKILFANFQIKRLKGNSLVPFLIDTLLGIVVTLLVYTAYAFLV